MYIIIIHAIIHSQLVYYSNKYLGILEHLLSSPLVDWLIHVEGHTIDVVIDVYRMNEYGSIQLQIY